MLNVATQESAEMIGLRDLRANLSSYVDEVKTGHSYTVTEHGRPVARLVPIAGQSSYERLVAQGIIQPAARRPGMMGEPVEAEATVSDLVGEQRR